MCLGPDLMRISTVCQAILACMPSDLFLDCPCSPLLQGTEICRLHIPRPQHQLRSIWVQPMEGSGKRLMSQRQREARVFLRYSLHGWQLRHELSVFRGSSSGHTDVSIVSACWVNLGPRLRKYSLLFLCPQRGCPQSQQEGPCPRPPVLQGPQS